MAPPIRRYTSPMLPRLVVAALLCIPSAQRQEIRFQPILVPGDEFKPLVTHATRGEAPNAIVGKHSGVVLLAGDVYGSAPRAMCICPQRGIADEFKRSDVVFVGTAVSGDVERVVLKVDRLWKGSLPPLATLLKLTERYCVVLQTLKNPAQISAEMKKV